MPEIIDAHQHFWDLQRFEYPWMTPDLTVLRRNYLPADLKPILEQNGIDRTILVQAQHSLEETRWFLELADENDFIAAVVGWVDLTDPNLEAVLDKFNERKKLVGIRHITHDEPEVDWIVRDEILRGLAVLEKRGHTFDLLFRPQHLKHTSTLATKFPNLKMVIDHIAKPLIKDGIIEGWQDDIANAARFPNVYCKLSGMITEADWQNWKPADLKPFVEHVVDQFGFDRLMFGSDWPVCLLAGSYRQVVEALREVLGSISESEKQKVFGEVAREFYGI